MYPKVLCLAAVIAVAIADGHSPAYSSAHVNKYDGHQEIVYVPYAPSHGYYDNRGYYGHNYYGHGHNNHGHGHNNYEHGHNNYGHGHNNYEHGHNNYGHGNNYYGHGHNNYGHGQNYYGHGHGHSIDYYAYPKYEFEYKVVDHHTGDIKAQQEHRDGDMVKGYYALHQPDGSERVVHYNSDKHSGFHANVRYNTHHLIPRHHHN